MKKYLFAFILSLLILAPTVAVWAIPDVPTPCSGNNCLKLTNPLKANTPPELIGQIINALLGGVGTLALVMFIYGGLTWMTSSGSQEKVKKGKDIVVWAAIGLVVVFSAYALTRFVLATLVS